MKTILHILSYAHLGGCERNCEMYISASTECRHRIVVLANAGPMSSVWENQGAEVIHLHLLECNRSLYLSLKKISNEQKYAAILYWSTAKMPLIRAAFRNQSCTLAVHIGNPVTLSFFSTVKFYLVHLLLRSTQRTLLFCCSRHVQESVFKNFFFKKFDSVVAHNPVKTLPVNPYVVRDLSVEDDIVLGMTARLDPIKDHKTVIKAFALILQNYPKAQLLLIGDGVLREELEQLCDELGIKQSVVFLGNVPNVYDFLKKMDLFVYSTTLAEGFGNVVSEAMANGLPCVISDLPMMHEVTGDGSPVYFFESHNVTSLVSMTIDLINNPQRRKQLSELAFERVQNEFSTKQYVEIKMSFLNIIY